ncbi:MAG: MBL fold metallo-hydrolase [Terriglobales bacterium]
MDQKVTNRREFIQTIAAGAAALPLMAQAAASSSTQSAPARTPPPIHVTQLVPNFWLLSGDGGNMGLVAPPPDGGGAGLLLIDTGYLERTADLIAAVAAAAPPGAIHTVFNTHWHVDHVGGNPALGQAGAVIVAQENVKTRLSETVTVAAMNNRVFQPLPPAGRPSRTFTTGGKLATGAGAAEYTHFPTAHTDGDSFIFFPERNILHCGDLFWNGIYPLIDYSTLGWIGGMAAANEKLLALCDAQTQIIPGHGALATKDELARSHAMLATLHDRLETMVRQGKSADEAVAAVPSREFDANFSKGMKPEAFVRMAYTGILHRQG